jgi:hypothetical protein
MASPIFSDPEVCVHSITLWPFFSIAAAALALVPTIQDSGHRSLLYWLVIPPLLAGVLAACSHLSVS